MFVSKNLIETVLCIKVDSFSVEKAIDPETKEELDWFILKYNSKEMPFDTFVFKCKKWSYSQCNEIRSYTEGSEIYQTQLDEVIDTFWAESEQEAIIRAAERGLK